MGIRFRRPAEASRVRGTTQPRDYGPRGAKGPWGVVLRLPRLYRLATVTIPEVFPRTPTTAAGRAFVALYEPKDRGVQADWAVSIEAEAMSWDAAEAYDRGYDEARASLDVDRLRAAIDAALHELGVPGPGYPAPVANAVDILRAALEEPTP